MLGFDQQEKEEIIRQFLGPGGSEDAPRCSHCGEVFQFRILHCTPGWDVSIAVDCPECANGFSWRQYRAPRPWTRLQMRYFLECLEADQPLICPADDCLVQYAEFDFQIVEFRCPYCNRRGKTKRPPQSTVRNHGRDVHSGPGS